MTRGGRLSAEGLLQSDRQNPVALALALALAVAIQRVARAATHFAKHALGLR